MEEPKMERELDFSIEEVEVEKVKVDSSNIQEGCWGDSGSDWANAC
jgi:hypothetical protein